MAKHHLRHGQALKGAPTKEYKTWVKMIKRCEKPSKKEKISYGNVKISKEWRADFINFFNDMGAAPSNEYSIERIDNNGNYCKENCRWATQSEQALNRNVRSDNSSGAEGVYAPNGKFRYRWRAVISVKGVRVFDKHFSSFEEAVTSRTEEKKKYLYVK